MINTVNNVTHKIIFSILLFMVASVFTQAGQEQTDIMNKDYSDQEVEDYFGEFLEIVERPYFHDGQVVVLDIGSFTINEKLGKGQEGIVYRVTNNETGEEYALKLPFYGSMEPKDVSRSYIKPLELLKTFDHPNIISVKANSRFMLMEKADGLIDDIKPSDGDNKIDFLNKIFEGTIEGIDYLESKGITFNDLYTSNVVFFRRSNAEGGEDFDVKIIDINGENTPGTDIFASIKSYTKDLYRSLRLDNPGLSEQINQAGNVEEMRTALSLNRTRPLNKRLSKLQTMDLDVTNAQVKKRRQGMYLAEDKPRSRRHGMVFDDDDAGAAGGCN